MDLIAMVKIVPQPSAAGVVGNGLAEIREYLVGRVVLPLVDEDF